jgi:hypothetical protein
LLRHRRKSNSKGFLPQRREYDRRWHATGCHGHRSSSRHLSFESTCSKILLPGDTGFVVRVDSFMTNISWRFHMRKTRQREGNERNDTCSIYLLLTIVCCFRSTSCSRFQMLAADYHACLSLSYLSGITFIAREMHAILKRFRIANDRAPWEIWYDGISERLPRPDTHAFSGIYVVYPCQQRTLPERKFQSLRSPFGDERKKWRVRFHFQIRVHYVTWIHCFPPCA